MLCSQNILFMKLFIWNERATLTHTSTYVRTHAHTYSTHVLIYSSTDHKMLSRMKGQCARAITNAGLASIIINTIPALVECRWKGMEQP